MTQHDLYTDADPDRPDVICDSNGQVTLDLCKRCGKGESELLDSPCVAGKEAQPEAVGWKLVPIEPTDAMAVAAIKASLNNPAINGVAQWRAMLAAAPTPTESQPAEADERSEREALARVMADKLMCWRLPADFHPDGGISFKPYSDYDHPEFGRTKHEPFGTNLFTHEQAVAMLLDIMPPALSAPTAPAQAEPDETPESLSADAYDHACDEMERWQRERRMAGKEVGTTGSLCDGIAWLYGYLNELESALATPPATAAGPSDAERYQLVRRGQHWSVIDGIGNVLRGDDLDAAIDAIRATKGGKL